MSGRRRTNFARGPIIEPVAPRSWPRWLIEEPNYQELFDAAYKCGCDLAERQERAILDAISADPPPGLSGQFAKLPRHEGWPAAASYVTREPEFFARTSMMLGPHIADPRALIKPKFAEEGGDIA